VAVGHYRYNFVRLAPLTLLEVGGIASTPMPLLFLRIVNIQGQAVDIKNLAS
jgi:hypothetical protein